MRTGIVVAALALSIAGSGPALADPVFVWRPSEGLNGGRVLPEDAFTVSTLPVSGGGVDFRSSEYGQFPNYTTRTVALTAGDILSVSVPSVFGFGQCQVLTDGTNRRPDVWVSISNSGVAGKYNVVIQARASGHLELTVMCATNTGADVEPLFHEYLDLTIS